MCLQHVKLRQSCKLPVHDVQQCASTLEKHAETLTLMLAAITAVRELVVTAAVSAHDKDINAVAVSPNDAFVCTASQDRTAKVRPQHGCRTAPALSCPCSACHDLHTPAANV